MDNEIAHIKIPEIWDPFRRKGSVLLDKLKPLTDWETPSFFFSTSSINDVLDNHKSIAVVIVNNTTRFLENRIDEIRERDNIYFISTSKLVSTKLDSIGLEYLEYPATLLNPKPNPIEKGKCIYFYSALGSHNFYGWDRIQNILKDNFPHLELIGAQSKRGNEDSRVFPNYSREDLAKELYPNVFLGIRLTTFDGLSGTVQELGLRGIKTIWNGGTPSALSYQTDEDIIEHIRREEMTIGTKDADVANSVAEFLNPYNEKYSHVYKIDTYLNGVTKAPKIFK